jgi:Dicarboxylate transport
MSQAKAPPRKTARRVLLLFGVVLFLGAGAAVLFREALATRAVLAYLEQQGVEVQSFEVTALLPGRVVARDVVLGSGGEVQAESLEVALAWPGLRPSPERVTIAGLRLALDITGEAPLLGSLQPFLERATAGADGAPQESTPEGEAAPPALPAVSLDDAEVVFATPSGPMTASLAAEVTPDGGGGQRAEASLMLSSDLGRLQAKLDAARDADGILSINAALAEGQLAWQQLSVGSLQGTLAASGIGSEDPRLAANLDLTDLSHRPDAAPALQLSEGKVEAAFNNSSALLTISLQGDGEQLDLTVSAGTPTGDDGTPLLVLRLNGQASSAGGLARLLALPGPAVTRGTLVLQGGTTGKLPEGETLLTLLSDPVEKLVRSSTALTLEAILADVALADGTAGLSGHLPLLARLEDDRLTVTLTQDAALRLEQPARDSLRALGLPDDVLPLIASGLNLSLRAGGELPLRVITAPTWPPGEFSLAAAARAASDQGLRLAADVEGEGRLDETLSLAAFSGRVSARAEAQRISLDGREARGILLELPLSSSYSADGLNLALSRAGRLRIEQFGAAAPLRLEAPLNFMINTLTLDATADVSGYSYRMDAAEDGAGFAVTLAEAAPLPVAAGALDLRLAGSFDPARGHDADLEIRLAGLGLPGYAFDAEAAELTLALDRELRPETSRFALGPFVLGGAEPLAAPLRLDGKLLRQGPGYDITATLALTGGERPAQALADVTARYGDDGSAQIEAVSRALVFAPDDLQPVHLSPLLAELKEVRGTFTAQADLALPRGPLRESARITLQDFSFDGPAGAVAGLNLDLKLTSLQPLASAAGQRLTLRSLEAGVPVEAIEVTFALDEVPSPRITLEDGRFGLAGATWQIEPATLDAEAARNRVVLKTDSLDLATFFQLIEVEGLSGEGRLKGRIPIEFSGDEVIVDNGRLEAQGPGRLSIRFAALRNALAGGGQTVELAIKALEDFQFETLSLTLDKTAENDATLLLSTLGNNPEVLDGQLFQFNINLESNLTSVLDALRQGYSLSDEALDRAWRLRQ